MSEILFDTEKDCEMINVTELVNARIPHDLKCGVCVVHTPHTTAGLCVNENADPDVKHDLLCKLKSLIPRNESYYQHAEGNSDAHLKAIVTGCSLTLPVRNGKLLLGIWQGVYFCEFDGPRTRKIDLTFLRGEE